MATIIRLPREEALEKYRKFLKVRFKELTKTELINRLVTADMCYARNLNDTGLSNLIAITTNKYGIER